LAVVVGNPSAKGLYTVRVRVPNGVKPMPHGHPQDRVYAVICGVFYIGVGDRFDAVKLQAYPPGSVVVLPGNTSQCRQRRPARVFGVICQNGSMRLGLRMVVVLAAGVSAAAEELPGELQAYLSGTGFPASEIAELRAGGVITRLLPQPDDNAAFVVGVARVRAPQEALVDGIRDIEMLRKGGRVLQIGRFGTPPSIEDVQPLIVETRDLDDLHKCRIGDCDIKLDAATIASARQIDWNAADAGAQASQAMKLALVAQAKDYLARGAEGMPVYRDNDPAESTAGEFAKLLQGGPQLIPENPDFYRYLLEFPNGSLPSVENFLYWSKEKLRKPVVSVVHVCLQRVERDGAESYFIALKHVYDSHYFLAYAEFLSLAPGPAGTGEFYLVRSVRARIDPPRFMRGLLLGKVKREMRRALGEDLSRMQSRLEGRTEDSSPRTQSEAKARTSTVAVN
jgi:hypothetical protein